MKQLIPELLILFLVGANLTTTCYAHHRLQERLNQLEYISIPDRVGAPSETLPPIELIPQRNPNENY